MMIFCRALIALLLGVFAGAATAADEAPTAGAKANRLLNAQSPYLRQHAYNPVDWHTWGPEAFEKARRENKPVFLSVGYATCYWCHVLARESFENTEIAKILNATTIPIKVDRERRPDVDATYMLATELMTQRGGWPNQVYLTPDLKPFYGFGYVPVDQFKQTIEGVAKGWSEQNAVILTDADRVAGVIADAMSRQAEAVPITQSVLRRASMHILARFDVFNGGLGTAPKFPQENIIQFLLHRAERDNDKVSGEAALVTLDNIVRGGIHDQLGGGFHRYAVDNAWAVPHFEKMLYNQALLVRALVRAYELTGLAHYAVAARSTLDFVLKRMKTTEGGFASAFDAETDGKEGVFYLWTVKQVEQALGGDADFAKAVFGITAEGNHEGSNTLRLTAPALELADQLQMPTAEFEKRLAALRAKLRDARDQRQALKRDDKILTGWNAMMVRALAEAAIVLKEPRYHAAATDVQATIMDKLGGRAGSLKRSLYDGAASVPATQSDYAFLGLSAVALFDLTGDHKWLEDAKMLARRMVELFEDKENGGYFLTEQATGFTRTKETDDSTMPSGNAAALELFARLTQRTPDVVWKQHMRNLQAAVTGIAATEPVGHAATLIAADIAERGESGPRQSAAHGAVRLTVARTPDMSGVSIRIKLAPGWHINAVNPRQDFLLPTRVKIDGIPPTALKFPSAVDRKLGFHNEMLRLYEGEVEITAPLPSGDAGKSARRISMDVQACSDKICLEPQSIRTFVQAVPEG